MADSPPIVIEGEKDLGVRLAQLPPTWREAFAKLDAVDREILNLKYQHRNLSLEKIGKLLDPKLTKQSVSHRVRKHGLEAILSVLDQDILERIRLLQLEALQIMADAMRGNVNKWIQFDAARTLLLPTLHSKLAQPEPTPVDELEFGDSSQKPSQPAKPS